MNYLIEVYDKTRRKFETSSLRLINKRPATHIRPIPKHIMYIPGRLAGVDAEAAARQVHVSSSVSTVAMQHETKCS